MDDRAPPHRVLLVRPSALGDVCRTVPVLVSLKRALPDAQIDWLVQDSFAPAIASHPDLSRVVAFPRAKFRAVWGKGNLGGIFEFLRELRGARYDWVIDCQGLARSGLLTRLTGAPLRVGHADAAELGWLGLNRRVRGGQETHTVERMLGLVESLGITPVRDMRLYTCEQDRAFVRTIPGLVPERYAVVAPTTRWPGKLWAMSRHAALIDRLLGDPVLGLERVVITGSESERGQCAELLEHARGNPRVIDLIGKTSIGQLMAVIEASSLLVGCDSAALHMGVGFDRALVGLYGPTRIDRVGPYRRGHHVVQRLMPGDRMDHKDETAGRALMDRITVEDVLEVVYGEVRARKRTGRTDAVSTL